MVMAKRKICVVTGTRAEYGLLRWVINGIANLQGFIPQIAIATRFEFLFLRGL